MLQPENGLDISEFEGDENDRELLLLLDGLLLKKTWKKIYGYFLNILWKNLFKI